MLENYIKLVSRNRARDIINYCSKTKFSTRIQLHLDIRKFGKSNNLVGPERFDFRDNSNVQYVTTFIYTMLTLYKWNNFNIYNKNIKPVCRLTIISIRDSQGACTIHKRLLWLMCGSFVFCMRFDEWSHWKWYGFKR